MANAIGAVASSVIQRAQVTVTQPVQGIFRVFAPDGPVDFNDLEQALVKAGDLAGQIAHGYQRVSLLQDPPPLVPDD